MQQQLGANFTQTAVSDHLDTSFTALGGFGASEIVGLAFAVVVSIITAGAASAAIGFGATAGSTFATSTAATAATAATATTSATVATTAGLGNIALSAAMAGFTSSIASQLTMTGSLNWGSAFEGAAVAGITAGLTNGITYNSDSGIGFTTTPMTVGGQTSSLASLAGANPLAGTSVSQASASTATTLETRGLAMLGEAGISAGVGTAIEGGSLGTAFKDALTQEAAAAGAFAIGGAQPTLASDLGPVGGELAYLALHGALGCAAGAASGQGCGGGAIGGATSALISPFLVDQAGGAANLTDADRAMITAIAVLSGGTAAGLLGQNATAAASAAENEALNNSEAVHGGAVKPLGDLVSQVCGAGNPPCSDAMIQTLINAQASNASQALGIMNAAAPYVGGALVGALVGPEIVAACTVNPVLCANEVSILAGEVYAGLNGMPVGTGASALAGVSSATNSNLVATEPNTAFFWSGRTNGLGGQEIAAQIAQLNNGTTLETLIAQNGIQMPAWDSSNPAVVQAWQNISAQYAAGASGSVRAVIGSNLRPDNVWETAELPALMNNPNVTQIATIDPATGATKIIFTRGKQ